MTAICGGVGTAHTTTYTLPSPRACFFSALIELNLLSLDLSIGTYITTRFEDTLKIVV